ncbi:MAG: T9SS type A sorting domain-containing protein [Bacteroidetes bacterium]|nr:T9SS type A sorting domain-containing protein [Bacteroidota bacterium]
MKKFLLSAFAFGCLNANAQTGAALNFDGVDDRVVVGTLPQGILTPFTVEAWVNPAVATTGTDFVVVSTRGGNPSNYNNTFDFKLVDGNKIYCDIGYNSGTAWDNTGIQAPFTYTAGQWVHVAFSIDGSGNYTFFANGNVVGSGTTTYGPPYAGQTYRDCLTSSMGGNTLTMGALSAGGGEQSKGSLDELRVWTITRSQSDVQTDMCSTVRTATGLLAYYNFDNGIADGNNTAITSVIDVTGHGYDGSLNNFALTGTTSNFVGNGGGVVTVNPTSTTVLPSTSTTLTASGTATYTWSTGDNTNTTVVSPAIATIYTVSGTSAVGCVSSTQDTIIIKGAALNFNGTNNYVPINEVISSDFTIEYWVKTTQTGGGPQWYSGIGMVDAEVSGVVNDFGTALVGNNFALGIGNPDVTITSTTSINDGNWHHVAGTWVMSTGAMSVYVDGVLESTGTGSTNPRNAPAQIDIGRILTGINYFNGTIDEVRIWNRALCQGEIQNSMNAELKMPQTGLMAYYPFNEGLAGVNNATVTVAADSSGNGNNGTLTNFTLNGTTSNWVAPGAVTTGSYAPAFVPPTVTVNSPAIFIGGTATLTANGATTYSWSTSATSASIAVTPTITTYYTVTGTTNGCTSMATSTVTVNTPGAALNFQASTSNNAISPVFSTLTDNITFGAYVNWSGVNTGGNQMIVTNGNTASSGYALFMDNSQYLSIVVGGVFVLTSTVTVAPNVWTNVMVTSQGNNWMLYVNGAAYTFTTTVTPNIPSGSFAIGSNQAGTENFDGDIDEVRLWNRALCQTEIQNYLYGELPMPQNGLLAYYKFNEGAAGANNASVTTVSDSSGNSNDIPMVNFTLNGANSNWVAPGAVTTGSYAPAYVAPAITISGNTVSICIGATTTLTATGTTLDTYTWSTSDNTTSVVESPTVNTTYSVSGTLLGCPSNVAVTTVTVNALPNVTATAASAAICTGSSDSLRATGAVSYAWNTSATSANISVSPTAATSYTVTGTDANGCVNTATVAVNVNALPTLSLTASSPSVCVNGTPITLTGSPAGGVYSGTHVSGNIFTPTAATGTFNVVYSYTNSTTSCSNKDSVALVVDACTGIARYAQNNLSVYPNPASNQVTVQASSELGMVTVYNAIGQVVEVLQVKDTQTQLNVSTYASGIYTILAQGTYIKFIKD